MVVQRKGIQYQSVLKNSFTDYRSIADDLKNLFLRTFSTKIDNALCNFVIQTISQEKSLSPLRFTETLR